MPQIENIIIDSDLGGDPDDAAAFAILLEHLKRNPARRLLCGVSSSGGVAATYRAPCMRALLKTYGFDVPVGAYQGNDSRPTKAWNNGNPTYITDPNWRYARAVAERFGKAGVTRAGMPSALSVLTTALKAAPDKSVTWIRLGSMQNIYDLMRAPGGKALLTTKLKRFVCVAGDYIYRTSSYNTRLNPTASRYVVANWPASVPFVSLNRIETGSVVCEPPAAWSPHVHPVKTAFVAFPAGRGSTDPLIVLYALEPGNLFGWNMQNGTFRYNADVDITLTFSPGTPGPFSFVKMVAPAKTFRSILNARIAALRT